MADALKGLFDFLGKTIVSPLGKALAPFAEGARSVARSIIFGLCEFIYDLIIKLYKFFTLLSTSRLLANDLTAQIAQRVGLILGIIMLFRVLFSFVQIIIEPDTLTDKDKGVGSIIKKVIIVIVMLGISTYAFDLLYRVESKIIESQVIAKILLPKVPTINGKPATQDFGGVLAEEAFHASYSMKDIFDPENDNNVLESLSADDKQIVEDCRTLENTFRYDLMNNGDFKFGRMCLTQAVTVSYQNQGKTVSNIEYVMNFNILIAIVAGLGIAYFLFMYCIKVGMRMIQLLLLEIMSPMAIISYLSPKKDNMFSKWGKLYFATYIDVFIRVMIINFAVFLITAIFGGTDNPVEGLGQSFTFWSGSLGGLSSGEKYFIILIMILAILSFAQRAPELLKQFLPEDVSKLGFGASMKDMLGAQVLAGAVVGGAIGSAGRFLQSGGQMIDDFKNAKGLGKLGALAGGLGRMGTSTITGGIGGATRGGYGGGTSKGGMIASIRAGQKAAADANLKAAQRRAQGISYPAHIFSGIQGGLGVYDEFGQVDTKLQAMDNLNSLINDEDVIKDYQKMYDSAVSYQSELELKGPEEGESSTDFERRIEEARLRVRNANARLNAAKDSLYTQIEEGNTTRDVTEIQYEEEYIDPTDGNTKKRTVTEKAVRDFTANQSMINAKKNAEKVAGKRMHERSDFKNTRNELRAEAQKNRNKKKS